MKSEHSFVSFSILPLALDHASTISWITRALRAILVIHIVANVDLSSEQWFSLLSP